ncbi:MAG: lipase family protein [Thermodesulfobacteriota bacterium]
MARTIRRHGEHAAATRAAARLVLAIAASTLLLACGDADVAREPERFTGTIDEFYVVPEPLPAGLPGELIRVQEVSRDGGRTTLRIMYHSRDARGRDRAVTGILTYPDAAPPDGGWPVVSLANGTTGLASPCALSRNGRPAPTFGVDGVGVVTDYVGLGPVGELHPYLSRPSEAHSVIDAVRAARNLREAGAGSRWLAIGHSQGGHAALATNELAEEYAPELELLGTVSLAPAALFDRTYGPVDEIVVRIVGVMALYGAAAEHPEIDPDDYVGPATAEAASVLEQQCLDDIINAFLPVPAEEFYLRHPLEHEPARSILLGNDVGGVAVESPLLLVSGTADQRVFVDRVRDLLDRLCEAGQVTEYLELEGATHDDEYARADAQIRAWLAARLAGEPAVDSCAALRP